MLPVILLFVSSLSFSQELLSEIPVETTKDASDFFSGAMEVVSSEEIQQTGYSDVSQILSQVPGVVSNGNGGFGSRTSLFIRGGEARHAGFSLDGLRLNDPSNTDRQFDGAFINPLILKEVKVYKGPQSIFYGPDAMAGLVEFVTDKGNGKNEFEYLLGAGSFDTYRSMFSQSWGTTHHQGKVSASSFKTNGISRLNKKRFNATERDGTLTHQVVSSSSHRFHKVKTDLLVGYNFGKSELDGLTDTKDDKSITHQFFLQQKSSYRLSAIDTLNLRTGQNRYHREVLMSPVDKHFKGTSSQIDFYWDRRATNLHTLIGMSLDHEKFSEDRELEKNNTLFSSYLTQKWGQDIYEFSYGLRHDRHQRFGDIFTYSLSPALNWGDTRLDYTYATGFKAPSLYQLYAPEMWGLPMGNKDLESERSYSHALNLNYALGGGQLTLSLFDTIYDDLINWTDRNGYFNQQKFRVQGVESSYRWTYSAFILRPYITIQDFKDTETTILRRPRNMWGADLMMEFSSSISGWARFEYRSSTKDINPNGEVVKINGHEKVDLGVTYARMDQRYSLKVMNIFDREYEQVYGYNTQPRSFMIEWSGKI